MCNRAGEAQRIATADVGQVAEELRETAHQVREAMDDEFSESVSERLERLEELMTRLGERVCQIEDQ